MACCQAPSLRLPPAGPHRVSPNPSRQCLGRPPHQLIAAVQPPLPCLPLPGFQPLAGCASRQEPLPWPAGLSRGAFSCPTDCNWQACSENTAAAAGMPSTKQPQMPPLLQGHRSTRGQSLPLKRGMLRYTFDRQLPVQIVTSANKDAGGQFKA